MEMENHECYYVAVYGGKAQSREILTFDEYLNAAASCPDFCGIWKPFESYKDAEDFIAMN